MKNAKFLIAPLVLIPLFFSCNDKKLSVSTVSSLYKDLEFDMPVIAEPVFPDNVVYINDFGAINDGETPNTKAIADAIEAVSKMGGGRVVIPSGIWLTGPIVMKSNIDIHTEEGALVIFSPDKDLYPLIKTSFEGYDTYRCSRLFMVRILKTLLLREKVS